MADLALPLHVDELLKLLLLHYLITVRKKTKSILYSVLIRKFFDYKQADSELPHSKSYPLALPKEAVILNQ
jgi:hypothetical protein